MPINVSVTPVVTKNRHGRDKKQTEILISCGNDDVVRITFDSAAICCEEFAVQLLDSEGLCMLCNNNKDAERHIRDVDICTDRKLCCSMMKQVSCSCKAILSEDCRRIIRFPDETTDGKYEDLGGCASGKKVGGMELCIVQCRIYFDDDDDKYMFVFTATNWSNGFYAHAINIERKDKKFLLYV